MIPPHGTIAERLRPEPTSGRDGKLGAGVRHWELVGAGWELGPDIGSWWGLWLDSII
jgi:hypothetical protein